MSEAQARALPTLGPEAVRLFALAMARQVAALQQASQASAASPSAASPSTPSGMIPPYQKPSTPRRRKTPGAKPGHAGSRRKAPPTIDQRIEHRLEVCPCCNGPLQRCNRKRTRLIEDIPQDITPIVTEHTIHRDYCPSCKKHVEPTVPDAMAGATLGHHVIALSSWFHYGLGLSVGQVREILDGHLHTPVTAGGLLDGWHRLGAALLPWYEQIAEEARASAVLHADETGWRVDGQTCWLWCFTTKKACYYLIDPSRGAAALHKFFVEVYQGTLVSDFWSAYDSVFAADNQRCIPHLLRELLKVDDRNDSVQWTSFSKQLKRLIRDALRLHKRPDFSKARYGSRIDRINRRLWELADGCYRDPDARRLAQRLSDYREDLFTFLYIPGVPSDNNHAERMIRPAVILRKNCLCNRSTQGAATQAILMSIYRTLKLRGLDPTNTIAEALKTYLQTGTLPPLPAENAASG